MGACIDAPRDKKSNKKNTKTLKAEQPKKNPLEKSHLFRSKQPQQPPSPIKPKYKSMSIDELLLTYRNEGTLELSSKMEGPKYLSNLVDGSSKVMRVFNMPDISEDRLDVYRQLLQLQVYENDEGSYMILDEYCCGEDLYQLTQKFKESKTDGQQNQLLEYIKEIFKIVSEFHRRKLWLGNLNISSFRRVSPFQREVRLVDFNLAGSVGDYEKMGFAHRENYQADYQFLGYLLQFMVSDQVPVFIHHKVQYSQFEVIPHATLIQSLLKGKKPTETQISELQAKNMILNERVSLGYRFRRDINKLLKMRKKRKAHNRKFYGEDTQVMISDGKFNDDGLYRLQAERIFQRIGSYIYRVRNTQEEAFLNYAGNNEALRRLKEIFLLTDGEKKMAELKECMSTIK